MPILKLVPIQYTSNKKPCGVLTPIPTLICFGIPKPGLRVEYWLDENEFVRNCVGILP